MNPLVVAIALVAVVALALPAGADHRQPFDGSVHDFGEMVDYTLIFPVQGANYYPDTFWACRGNPCGYHHAQDIMAAKMTPVVAAAAGTVRWVNYSSDPTDLNPERCCTIVITHDDGWDTWYLHLNNDTPGTDDGLGWGIAEGILPGTRVTAGQLIGWVGDSGNSEWTSPHLHFELYDPENVIVNPYDAMRLAESRGHPRCAGLKATHLDGDGDGVIVGTPGDDVIVGSNGDDHVRGGDGADTICTLAGADLIMGGKGNDVIYAGPGDDILKGQAGDDRLYAGKGDDSVFGGGGMDVLVADVGTETLDGGRGRDTANFTRARRGLKIDLGAGKARRDILTAIEDVIGTRYDDKIIGDDNRNVLRGFYGDDILIGNGGNDGLLGQGGDDIAKGGSGNDRCVAETLRNCER
jgi:Ca2+-binding RTX toxin-like protein